jgi:uracil-DNA glycosylase family protein
MDASAADFLPRARSLASLRRAAQGCRGCDLWKDATQTVFGEGRSRAELMLVGEQPGDKEDLEGEPFVGPAGGLLDRALVDAGIERDDVYLTNAVKHFKWRARGKRRLHQTPRAGEVEACRPSAILRVREREQRHDAFAGLVEDLEAVCAAMKKKVG